MLKPKLLPVPARLFLALASSCSIRAAVVFGGIRPVPRLQTGAFPDVTDATGAVLPNANVTVTGPTGQTLHAITNSTGSYSLGVLIPGVYQVRVEAKGFKTSQLTIDVKVDNAANASVKLEIGQESTVVDED